MNNARDITEPTTAEILQWFDDAGIALAAIRADQCPACSTPAAA